MKGNGKTMVVTKAERTLCEEIKGFSKKQTALLNAILEGINIAAREAKVKDLRSSSTIEALKKALYIELYVENNKLIMVYKKPYDVLVFERGKPGEEELSEKELCYMLMIYK